MKVIEKFKKAWLIAATVLTTAGSAYPQIPTIVINGDSASAAGVAKFPYWLNDGARLANGNLVLSIPVLEYNIVSATGGNDLVFNQVILVSSEQTVPAGKAWKIESVIPDKTVGSTGSSGGDNWGGQTVYNNASLSGAGISASPLGIAQQGATAGQVLQWNGSAWIPADASAHTDTTLTGDGTTGNPFGLAQQSATTGQVLQWNGTAWVPATNSPAPADCPAGFTAVNLTYCIETNERAPATFWNAQKTCQDLNYTVATWREWRYACQKAGLSPALQNMTNNWEWMGDINNKPASYDTAGGYVVGNGGCTESDHPGNPSADESNSWSFRCVFYR